MRTFTQEPRATQQPTSAKSTISGGAHLGQRHKVNLQSTIGVRSTHRLLQTETETVAARSTTNTFTGLGRNLGQKLVCSSPPPSMRTNLKVNRLGDRYEHEADRLADQAMRMSEPFRQRQLENRKEGLVPSKPLAPRHDTRGVKTGEAPLSVHDVLRSPGRPLDFSTRAFMEPRFGHDFSRVRVHADAPAAESARSIEARAYARGANEWTPTILNTKSCRRLR
jgi:hypothetical protein